MRAIAPTISGRVSTNFAAPITRFLRDKKSLRDSQCAWLLLFEVPLETKRAERCRGRHSEQLGPYPQSPHQNWIETINDKKLKITGFKLLPLKQKINIPDIMTQMARICRTVLMQSALERLDPGAYNGAPNLSSDTLLASSSLLKRSSSHANGKQLSNYLPISPHQKGWRSAQTDFNLAETSPDIINRNFSNRSFRRGHDCIDIEKAKTGLHRSFPRPGRFCD